MKYTIVGVIFLSAQFLAVSTAPVVPGQVGCAEGEPSPGIFKKKTKARQLNYSAANSIYFRDLISFVCISFFKPVFIHVDATHNLGNDNNDCISIFRSRCRFTKMHEKFLVSDWLRGIQFLLVLWS